MGSALELVGDAHGRLVHGRRVQRLADAIASQLQPGWRVLDIGCGDGLLSKLVTERVGELDVCGYDVLKRADTHVPVRQFDGNAVPEPDDSADAVVIVDVLHHTEDPNVLLAEAARIARHAVVIKDHRLDRLGAWSLLSFMDWVGNRPHGVRLPYNYWGMESWHGAWERLGLDVVTFQTDLGLYPWPASWVFESGLHFVVNLRPRRAEATA